MELFDEPESGADGYLRKLGGHERLLYLYSKDHPRHFCVVAEFNSSHSPTEFVLALAEVQAKYSILNVDICEVPELGPVFRKVQGQVTTTIEHMKLGEDWKRAVECELRTAFPTNGSPLVRARLLVLRRQQILILTFHHAIADGLSAVTIIKEVAHSLEGKNFFSSPMQAHSLEDLATQVPQRPKGSFDFDNRRARDALELRDIARQPLWRPFDGDRPNVYATEMDRATAAEISQSCRRHGATVHGALCAAVALEASSPEAHNFTITSAIDLRKIVGLEPEEVGLFVGAGTVRFPGFGKQNFWSLARTSIAGLAASQTKAGALRFLDAIDTALPPDADKALASGFFGSLRYDAVVTNMGRLSVPVEYETLKITAIWGPFVQGRFKNEKVIGASSLDGVLRIVQTTPEHIPSFIEGISTRLINESRN